jgi:hypothetical protein
MDFDDAVLRDIERRIEQQLAQAEQFRSRVEATTVTVESPGGEAIVTVNSSGGLEGLELTDEAMRLPRDELAQVILMTSRQAQVRLAERMAELAAGIYGAGSETADFISSAYAEQLPSPAEEVDRGGGR